MVGVLRELEMKQLNVQVRVATVEEIELLHALILQKAEFDV